jgi:hypothetical protein
LLAEHAETIEALSHNGDGTCGRAARPGKCPVDEADEPVSLLQLVVSAELRWRMKKLQKPGAVHSSVHNLFNQERHLTYEQRRSEAFSERRSVIA